VEYNDSTIPADVGMIQEDLREAGYTTLAFTGGAYVSEEFGFDRGFDSFSDWWMFFDPEKKKRTFGELRDNCWTPVLKAEEAFSTAPNAKPLFMFVHTYFIHEYFLFGFDADDSPTVPRDELNTAFTMEAPPEIKQKSYNLAAKDLDERLYLFVQNLAKMRKARNLAIVITSDHGEGLGDRHSDYFSFAHAHSPYSDQIHVPLAIYGIKKGTYDNLISLRDVPGIIRTLAGLEGGTLIPSNEFVISEYVQYNRQQPPKPRTVAVTFRDKRVLLTDRGTLHLYLDKADTVDALSSDIEEQQTELSASAKESLRALGYLR
jgi:membrane-anchored protein YejM (alkaline phosphatase superfamily)